jgi:hypothetical protein
MSVPFLEGDISSELEGAMRIQNAILRVLLLLAFYHAKGAKAADVLPVGNLDSTSTGKIVSAKVLNKGDLKGATHYEGGAFILPLGKFASEGSGLRGYGNQKLVRSVNRFGAFVGYGIANWMEFNLGLRGSSESMNSSQRRDFYLDGAREGSVQSGGGFDGVVLSSKFKLLDQDSFKLSTMAFYEGASATKSWQSVSKSEKDKMGLILSGSYSFKSIGVITANLGYRSRKAEEVGALYIGNESFARISGLYFITPRFGAFLSLDTRSIRVADETRPNFEGYLDYKSQAEISSEIGLSAYVYDNYRLTGFVGGGLPSKSSVGTPERSYGLSLTMPLLPGKKSNSEFASRPKVEVEEPTKGEAAEIQIDASNSAKDLKNSQKSTEPAKLAPSNTSEVVTKDPAYPEMENDGKNLYDDTKVPDDFKEAALNANKAQKQPDPMLAKEMELTEIQRKETEKLKAIEAKRKEAEANAGKVYFADQKKKAARESQIQKRAVQVTRPYSVTDKDVEFKSIDD